MEVAPPTRLGLRFLLLLFSTLLGESEAFVQQSWSAPDGLALKGSGALEVNSGAVPTKVFPLELRPPELRGPPGASGHNSLAARPPLLEHWQRLWAESRSDLLKVLLIVFSNFAYLLPARFAWRRRMFYKSLMFISITLVSSVYHAFDTELLPRESGDYMHGSQPADFLLSYYLFVMMALVCLGPEDEEKIVVRRNWFFLWTQRVVALLLIQYLLSRSLEARFDVVSNLPALVFLISVVVALHYGLLDATISTEAPKQLAVEALGAVVALAIYAIASSETQPYWAFHSLWHVVTASLAWFILVSREAPKTPRAPRMVSV